MELINALFAIGAIMGIVIAVRGIIGALFSKDE